MPQIDCVLNEPLRPMLIDQTEGTNFFSAIYEATSSSPILKSIEGVSYLAHGDEYFCFDHHGNIDINSLNGRKKIIGGFMQDNQIHLRWVGYPDMIFVNYLIEKKRERYAGNWLEEGF